MIAELPEKHLEPKPIDPQDKFILPPNSKPVSQITEEEKRLYGICRQLGDSFNQELEAYTSLRINNKEHSPDVCQRFSEQMMIKEDELFLVSGILLRSIEERLGFEREYVIDNLDIYAVSDNVLPNLLDMILPDGFPTKES